MVTISVWDVVRNPRAAYALLRLASQRKQLHKMISEMETNRRFCYTVLETVSRSFAAVIMELPEELRDAVGLFYLVLRGLDTVEDDMKYPSDKKHHFLTHFHEEMLQSGFHIDDCGDGHYRELMREFHRVTEVLHTLRREYLDVIVEITQRMGAGMLEFLQRDVVTLEDWDLYCHYVAGLVGIGLSKLFVASKLQPAGIEAQDSLSNSMGLFLQKVNIIRDYREDIDEARIFWPSGIWSLYTDRLDNFKKPEHSAQAVACLNHLITNALSHVPDCLTYMTALTNNKVFTFCAIPQVMAIGTLAVCFNNPRVFDSVVKIDHGTAAQMILDTNTMESVYRIFHDVAVVIEQKINPRDPSAEQTRRITQHIQELCRPHLSSGSTASLVVAWLAFLGSSFYLVNRHTGLFRAARL